MLDKLDASHEAPAVRYERLLQNSIRLHQEFNAEGSAIAAIFRTQEQEAEERAAAHRDTANLIDRLTRERLALIRVIARLPNSKDAI